MKYYSDLENVICDKKDSILSVMQKMSEKHKIFCCVLDGGKLSGFINDSDIRRAIIKGISLEVPIEEIANKNPVTARKGTSKYVLRLLFEKAKKEVIPIITDDGTLDDIMDCRNYFLKHIVANKAFIMAGGEGKRLRPITESIPKSMVKISKKPIVEMIIENIIEAGFVHIVFCVNYLASQIKDYFGDGKRWGIEIEYIHEPKKLGTAGALSLYDKKLEEPFFVFNGDVLSNLSLKQLIEYHKEEECVATICVAEYDFQIPYGAIKIKNNRLESIIEKPIYSYFVNAGIYVFNPDVINLIPKNEFFDMTDLLEKINKHHPGSITCYPIHESWRDIGSMKDYNTVLNESGNVSIE